MDDGGVFTAEWFVPWVWPIGVVGGSTAAGVLAVVSRHRGWRRTEMASMVVVLVLWFGWFMLMAGVWHTVADLFA